jgi:opacity protein-like surface antigen
MIRRFLLLLALLFAAPAGADCDDHAVGELWADEEGRIAGLDLSGVVCTNRYQEYRVGISYFGNDDYLYEGVSGSARLRVGDGLSAFVGAGVLTGRAELADDVDSDGVDNDGDGSIDEPGEEQILDDYWSAFVYPEAGIALRGEHLGITLSARRFYGREFNGEVIYSFGFTVGFGGDR